MPEQLTNDIKELVESLNKWQAQYLFVGAHALGVYTEPRGLNRDNGSKFPTAGVSVLFDFIRGRVAESLDFQQRPSKLEYHHQAAGKSRHMMPP